MKAKPGKKKGGSEERGGETVHNKAGFKLSEDKPSKGNGQEPPVYI